MVWPLIASIHSTAKYHLQMFTKQHYVSSLIFICLCWLKCMPIDGRKSSGYLQQRHTGTAKLFRITKEATARYSADTAKHPDLPAMLYGTTADAFMYHYLLVWLRIYQASYTLPCTPYAGIYIHICDRD